MRVAALVCVLLLSGEAAEAAETAAQLLSRGETEYHAGHFAVAVEALRAAFDGMMTPAAQQQYIERNEFPQLPQLEESLVYLALADAKLGRDDDARDAVLRLVTAERIAPAYGGLAIERDRTEFETLAQRLVPDVQLAGGTTVAMDAAERAVMLRLIEERAAPKRAEIEKQAAARIAEAKKKADDTVAAATPAPRKPAPAAPPPVQTSDALRARYDAMARRFASQSPGRYTVQIEIACETASVTHDLRSGGDAVWFVPVVYRGRSCYRVFWSHFATADDAQRGIATMPAALRSGSAGAVVHEPPKTP